METVFFDIGVLLLAAKVAEGIGKRLGLGSVVTYTAAGLLLGPVFHVVAPTSDLGIAVDLGVFFLFFLIGVDEIDIVGFKAAFRGRFLVAGVVALVLPIGAMYPIASEQLGLAPGAAVAISGIAGLSSLGLVVKVLSETGMLKKPLGLEVFTTVVIAELIGLVVVGFALEQSAHSEDITLRAVLITLGQIAGFVVGTALVVSRVLPLLVLWSTRLLRTPQLSFGLMAGALFVTVALAEDVGLHGSLAALLFGVTLAGLPSRMRVEVMPGFRSIGEGLFVPLFFAAAGLRIDWSFLELPWETITIVVVVAVGGKFAGSLFGVAIAQLNNPLVLTWGLMGKGVAEMAVLVVMQRSGMITTEVFSLFAVIMLGYIVITPTAIRLALARATTSTAAVLPHMTSPRYARYAFADSRVEEILEKNRMFPQSDVTVQTFTEKWLVPDQEEYVVLGKEGRPVGLLSLARLRFVDKDVRGKLTIGALMRKEVYTVFPAASLEDLLDMMVGKGVSVVPVTDPGTGRVLGAVTYQEALRRLIGHEPASH